ncbi:MAG: response regulator [Chloroflexi bacterium]|nr:response regulator [Chloroflexota bacterium]
MSTILVIEDEQPIRENIVEFLNLEGYEVLEADDGLAGIEMVRQHQPDLVICDIAMPHLSGYDVLLKIREDSTVATTPFIFLTARADRTFMRHGMELGADDYLTKPFTEAELLAATRAQLKKHMLLQDADANELKRARRSLIRLITHELRTPLASLITTQDLITRQIGQLSAQELGEMLGALRSNSQRLRHVTEQIVFSTQLESGELNWQRINETGFRVQLWEIMTVAINLARSFAYRNRDGQIELHERDRVATIVCQMDALKHALAELITNALNYSPEDRSITISQWQADGRVWVTITDQGLGIPADQIARAMGDFQQINRESQEQQGLGLGLPLARRIIELHQGTMQLDSVIGKGTQITISLPMV